jgi:hypothetical protein
MPFSDVLEGLLCSCENIGVNMAKIKREFNPHLYIQKQERYVLYNGGYEGFNRPGYNA